MDVRGYVHAAVGEGERVRVAGHALLLAVVGAGGGSHGVTRVDVVRGGGLPAGRRPAKTAALFVGGRFVIDRQRPAGFWRVSGGGEAARVTCSDSLSD